MSQHTPGPWFVAVASDGFRTVRVADVGCTNGRLIAEFIDPDDAPLIAAAPDLLTRAQALVDAMEVPRSRKGGEAYFALMDTIAKAEGRA